MVATIMGADTKKLKVKKRSSQCRYCGSEVEVLDGDIFRQLREGQEWTLRYVAEKLDVTPQYLHDMERNRRKVSNDLLKFWEFWKKNGDQK